MPSLWRFPRVPMLGPSVPRAHGRLAEAIGRFMLGVRGWTVEGDFPDLPKMVMAIAPHTSNWDFTTGLWVKLALRLGVRFVGKHTLFVWPLAPLLRWLGGVPVDRQAAAGFVEEAARAFRVSERMILVMTPEGTRRRAEKWKSGFYRIALAAKVPILLVRFDYSRRAALIGPLFHPSGDYETDLCAMRGYVQPGMALRPENYA
jgi:1-acyl-sn-glycerol-3-phosphate acyltransferase